MKKVVVTGPESSGKSTLCKHLSESLFTPCVREYAREFIEGLERKYVQNDLVKIAKGQLSLEQDILSFTPSILLCDTDLLTIKIWSEYKYDTCNQIIIELLKQNLPDLYLLCSPNIPWEKDEQRENPNDREEIFEIYKNEIIALKVPCVELKGNEENRLMEAMQLISNNCNL